MDDLSTPVDPIEALRILLADEARGAEILSGAISLGRSEARAHRRTLLRLQRGERLTRGQLLDELAGVAMRDAALGSVEANAQSLADAFDNLRRKVG
jgi:hypothetical protein